MNELIPRNPDFKKTIEERLKGQHFMNLIGFKITEIEAGRISGSLNIEQHHLQQHGFLHGGVSSTIMDIVMGFAAYSLLPAGKGVVTANLSVDYLNPGTGNFLEAVGIVDKAGSKMLFCSAKLYTGGPERKVLIASGKSIMAVIDKV